MAAVDWDFTIEANADFDRVLTWLDVNLDPVDVTGYSAKMQVRDIDGALITMLSTGNGRITLGGVAGTITLHMDAADTAHLLGTETGSPHVHDLLMIDGTGNVTRLVQGEVVVSPGVTEIAYRAIEDAGVSFGDTLVAT